MCVAACRHAMCAPPTQMYMEDRWRQDDPSDARDARHRSHFGVFHKDAMSAIAGCAPHAWSHINGHVALSCRASMIHGVRNATHLSSRVPRCTVVCSAVIMFAWIATNITLSVKTMEAQSRGLRVSNVGSYRQRHASKSALNAMLHSARTAQTTDTCACARTDPVLFRAFLSKSNSFSLALRWHSARLAVLA